MDEKKQEELDKRLRKFAVRGQEKLVGQLRQMLNTKNNKASANKAGILRQSEDKPVDRKQLYELMDSVQTKAGIKNEINKSAANLYFEVLCKPTHLPGEIEPDKLKYTQQFVKDNIGDKSGFTVFFPETAIIYSRQCTLESIKNSPEIFDPKVQSIAIAETLRTLGQIYQNLGMNFHDKFEIVFRYSDATDLAVGSVGPETFLPSVKYNKSELTLYIVRELHELIGEAAGTATEIVMELLKRLRYQGIVNKDFFIHAISKHWAKNNP